MLEPETCKSQLTSVCQEPPSQTMSKHISPEENIAVSDTPEATVNGP